MWIPSHVGIKEKADEEAKKVTTLDVNANYEILTDDVTKYIKEYARQKWQTEWEKEIKNGNKLSNLKKTISKWTDINSYDRKDQTVLTRIRIGHTNLTHVHLIEKSSSCLFMWQSSNSETYLRVHK